MITKKQWLDLLSTARMLRANQRCGLTFTKPQTQESFEVQAVPVNTGALYLRGCDQPVTHSDVQGRTRKEVEYCFSLTVYFSDHKVMQSVLKQLTGRDCPHVQPTDQVQED